MLFWFAGFFDPAEAYMKSHDTTILPSISSINGKVFGKYTAFINQRSAYSYQATLVDNEVPGFLILAYDKKRGQWICKSDGFFPEESLPALCK